MLDASVAVVFAVAALAVWRGGHPFVQEDGPWDLTVRLREMLGQSWTGRAMDCFYCVSLWIAAPIAVMICRGWADGILIWLALSGAACLLDRIGAPAV